MFHLASRRGFPPRCDGTHFCVLNHTVNHGRQRRDNHERRRRPEPDEAELIGDDEVIEAQNKERPHATTTPRAAVVSRTAVRLWPRVRPCAHYRR